MASVFSIESVTREKLMGRNPRNGEFDFSEMADSLRDIDALCMCLRSGQKPWEEAGVAGRVAALQEFRQAMLDQKQDLIDLLVHDTGRSAESFAEFDGFIRTIERWCREAPEVLELPPPRPSRILPFVKVYKQVVPYTLVGVISPWNFPLLLSFIDAIPALLAGCAVLLKPSEVTPRLWHLVKTIIHRIPLLTDVLGVVLGGSSTGEVLIEMVDMVCFTGSVATGRRVAVHAARRLTPVFLELGGKDAAIVTKTADLDRAAAAILWGGVVNNGQSCMAIERVYVDRSVYESFVDLLVNRAKRIRLAFPSPTDGQLGPFISSRQALIVEEQLGEAIVKGARALTGGEMVDFEGGKYLAPTILVDVNSTMKVMTEETFGPILPVVPFDSIEDGIAEANDSVFGLSGAVFAGTEEEALAVARQLNVGAVSVNDTLLTTVVHDAEKTSFGQSGVGPLSRMGQQSILRFFRTKALLSNINPKPDPWWYP